MADDTTASTPPRQASEPASPPPWAEEVAPEVRQDVLARYRRVLERLEAACERSGRDPAEVTLVGASKRQPVERLRAAWLAGLRVFGENRVQEAEEKKPHLPAEARWHLLGPLQSNKAKLAASLFDVVHSLDRKKIARYLDRQAGEDGKSLPCFVEVNLGEEESKHGFHPGQLLEVVRALAEHGHLEIVGLMAIPPLEEDAEGSRPWFVKLRELRDRVAESGLVPAFQGLLSMGMSADFEVAIEEGATHVRVGTDLFGPRD